MTQQFFVSKGRTIRGPITNRQRGTGKDGRVVFTCDPPKTYGPFDEKGNPKPLPSGFVDYLQNTKDTNGQTKFQNMVDTGFIVFEAGAQSPIGNETPPPIGGEYDLTPRSK
jgi:hypothetical protein